MKSKYHLPEFKRTKLTQSGMLHHIIPLVVIVAFGVFGVGYYVFSRAATPAPDIVSNLSLKGDGNWCITDQDAKTTANNPVLSAGCGGETNQQWTYTANAIEDKALSGTHCLDLLNKGTTAGTKVVMNACNGSTSQQWRRIDGKGFQSVSASVNKNPGNCLAVYGGITGQQLRINTCNMGYDSQGWTTGTYTTKPTPTPTPSPTPPPTTGEHIITTLYSGPGGGQWPQVFNSSPTVKYAILDDGGAVNASWSPLIADLKKAGITPLWYIWTGYGGTSLASAEASEKQAASFGVPDPMFDGMGTNNFSYYDSLYNYSSNDGANAVVFNAGTLVPQQYMTFGSKEIIQVFEGSAGGFEGTTFPAWMKDYPASEFSATLSAGTAGSVGGDVKHAVTEHIGNFYEDDLAEPNPNYGTLPAFWTAEVNDVKNGS